MGLSWGGAVCLAALAACAGAPDDRPLLAHLQETGVVRIGYANEAPYAYRDTATGRLTGEAPEIARVILARMGVGEVEGVLTEFGSLIPGLHADRFDIIAAGMYVTPARCTQVAFSEPTYGIGNAFIVREGNPLGLHSYADVRDSPDATIGVVTGAIERAHARSVGVPEARILTFPDAPSALAGVRAERVSAYAATALTVQSLLARDASGVEQAMPFTDPVIDGEIVRGFGAFAFRQRDDDLRAEFNRHLAAFIGTEEHLRLVAPFGFTAAQLPGEVTTRELCGEP